MSPKPQFVRCSRTTAAGKPCKAWAIHGSDPPACAAHARRNTGAGAPLRNQNARTHGFYGRLLSPEEVADVLNAADMSLDEEIACARVALRRVLEFLQQDAKALNQDQYIQVIKLIFYGTRTIARLLGERSTLTDQSAQAIADFINQALDRMSEEFGRPL